MKYFVYILYSENHDTYYKGQTSDLTKRLERHNSGSEKSTSKYRPWKLVWKTEKPNRSQALILERKLKNLSKERTKAFIEKYQE
ncbi:GIY-YIG nuclease family protein [Aestuariivivens insulae]|uniref:GIY-YIG nuclease family protein n=1 Tax=Aestuariivivens insulae TaxID=1621988 RepID=UPI001F59A54C|nr:GIY-YIG nuclease family protein [Aestuariivivens insulae]